MERVSLFSLFPSQRKKEFVLLLLTELLVCVANFVPAITTVLGNKSVVQMAVDTPVWILHQVRFKVDRLNNFYENNLTDEFQPLKCGR